MEEDEEDENLEGSIGKTSVVKPSPPKDKGFALPDDEENVESAPKLEAESKGSAVKPSSPPKDKGGFSLPDDEDE